MVIWLRLSIIHKLIVTYVASQAARHGVLSLTQQKEVQARNAMSARPEKLVLPHDLAKMPSPLPPPQKLPPPRQKVLLAYFAYLLPQAAKYTK